MNSLMTPKKRVRKSAESPFWISFSDLMTALMIMFLIVMVASLNSMTKRIQEVEAGEKARAGDIARLCERLKADALKINRIIQVDCRDNRISFGEAGRFGTNEYSLSEEGKKALADVVPIILDAADSQEGKRWMKQVVVEGFTDPKGSYLYNLHLSLQRSEWVMCSLIDPRSRVQKELTTDRRSRIQGMFLAGGVSFAQAKDSDEASRRVEFKLQFLGLKDQQSNEQDALMAERVTSGVDTEKCQLKFIE